MFLFLIFDIIILSIVLFFSSLLTFFNLCRVGFLSWFLFSVLRLATFPLICILSLSFLFLFYFSLFLFFYSLSPQEGGRDSIEKYMKDLSQMMDGMLDLNRRNQLPDRERAICLKLLLRITLKVFILSCFILLYCFILCHLVWYHLTLHRIILFPPPALFLIPVCPGGHIRWNGERSSTELANNHRRHKEQENETRSVQRYVLNRIFGMRYQNSPYILLSFLRQLLIFTV